jgi:hypothetical protein
MWRSFILVGVLACTSADYGAPTAQTDIRLAKDGGFAGPASGSSVRILGTTATFMSAGRNGTATMSTDDVAAIIGALEDASFLDLHGSYTECMNAPTDMPVAQVTATLAAGTNMLSFYTGCKGGTFDDLQHIEKTIEDRSGFTAWVSNP